MNLTLSGAGAFLASAGALFFALGYVVVNARLASYGLNEIVPPSARQVAVGMLISTFLAGAYLFRFLPVLRPETVVNHLAADTDKGTRWARLRRRVLLIVRRVGAAGVVLAVISGIETAVITLIAQPTDDREPGFLLQLILSWNVLPIAGLALIPLEGPWYGPRINLRPARPSLDAIRVLAAVPILVLSLALFAQSVFKYIPQWAGGGRLESVQILLTDADRPLCQECSREGATFVLFEDGDRVVLFLDGDSGRRVVELPRALIRAVIHAPHRP